MAEHRERDRARASLGYAVSIAVKAAGYSGTPLAKKLGIAAGATVLLVDAPEALREWLAPLPPDVRFVKRLSEATDIVHLFVTSQAQLGKELARLRKALRSDATLWVSWPKKAAKVETDVTEDAIRAQALPLGFVDVKVCAVNEVWSGLKLVIRKALR